MYKRQAKEYNFDEAKAAATTFNVTGYGGKRDWRVPTVRELQSLRVCSTGFFDRTIDLQDGGKAASAYCNENANNPTIDTSVFPLARAMPFWSASPNAGDSKYAMTVNFSRGIVDDYPRGSRLAVRLVR